MTRLLQVVLKTKQMTLVKNTVACYLTVSVIRPDIFIVCN